MADGAPVGGKLADNIVFFGRALRSAGLPVGPGDILDAVAATEAGGIGSRADLHATLHAVFVRRHEHTILFDQAFRLFFRRRDLVEKLLGQLSPAAPPDRREPERPKPGEERVAAAMRPKPEMRDPPPPEEDLSSHFAASGSERLKARDFAQMSAAEIAEAKRLIARLVMPDDRRPTRRLVPAARPGSVDLRRTLRRSLRDGGASIALAYRKPDAKPPPIVALVDISGSMEEYSRLFLHFLHALGERRRNTHAFVFATRLTNVTRELRGRDPDEALERAAARVIDWDGGTRIADALASFNRDWSRRVLGGGATVLLFTDGLEREVGSDLAFEADRLHRSCRRLVWLNPLLRFDGFEPRAAGVRALLPHVDTFRPIHSLRSMAALVDALAAADGRRRGVPDRSRVGRAQPI